MTEKKQFIKASTELKCEIATKFGTSPRTVQAALNYETRSPFARLLRKYAVEQGCKIYEVVLASDQVVTL